MSVIPRLPIIWDEPFSDSSQIPTLLVCELAKQHVTVCLSGDGGDELFCGYNRYNDGYQVWRKLRYLPTPLRQALGNLVKMLPGMPLERLVQLLPERFQVAHLADRLPKLADVIKESSGQSYYHQIISHWKKPTAVVRGGREPRTIFDNSEHVPDFSDLREYMMYLDSMTYLPDDILTKVDRASMGVSLEVRAPLLDHRVVEFAWSVPMELKYRNRQPKWLLRQLLNRYIPEKLMSRPKMGFSVPIEQWLHGPLREWAEDLLDSRKLREDSFFNTEPIQKMWHEHVTGRRRWHYCIWNILMFQSWLENEKNRTVEGTVPVEVRN